jgi:gamma-glutamylcyclotransferase (GGCT)/AIG2-like uncharacterized protein YtfP
MKQLFVYGTLLFPEIVEKLTGKQFKTSSAVIRKFARKRIVGCNYPAIIEDLYSEVKGILIQDVDE